MIDTLAIFADQVTTVAREVGIEGKLGGQAKVPGAAGTWKDLTDNVNQLAAEPDHPGASDCGRGDRGDEGRFDALDHGGSARGSCALERQHQRDDPQPEGYHAKNTEQDWLKTNLAQFTPHASRASEICRRGPADPVRAGAVGRRAAGGVLPDAARKELQLKLLASYAIAGANRFQRVPWARGSWDNALWTNKQSSIVMMNSDGLSVRLGRNHAAQHHCRSRSL